MADVIAGLVLGGIPIALWALEKYQDPVKSYFKYDMTLSTLRDNIFVQKQQLYVTFDLIGLSQPTIEELRVCLEEKYPNQHREFLSIIGHMEEITKNLLDKLQIDMNGKPLWTSEPPERVRWEWRRVKRSFRTKERQALVDQLQYWNTALKNCFEKPEVPAEDEDTKVQELQARFNLKLCDSVRENVQAIHEVLKDSWNCVYPCPHYAAIDLCWQPKEPAAPSVFDMALSFRDISTREATGEVRWRKLQIKAEKTDLDSGLPPTLPVPSPQSSRAPSPTPSTGSKKSNLHLFHGRRKNEKSKQATVVAPPFTATQLPTRTPHLTDDKISCLCAHVRKELKASVTLGYLPDPDPQQGRKFYLSHVPKANPKIVKAMPLRSLLLTQQPNSPHHLPPHLALSAKQRYGLAASLAWAVLHLSCTPWLDDAWNGEQVSVFLECPAAGRELLSKNPCISYLFETHTTSSTPTPIDRFNNNQIRNRILFTLATLLIELCINKSFEELRQQGLTGSIATTVHDDFKIAESKIDEVYLQAGNSYGYAVQRCLRCEFPGRDVTKRFDFSTFRRHFYNNVVAPVQATYIKHP
ncbi:hypothetical protein AOQ84DRAFT_386279 [Glonium stellatum]|uniref:DUF7580 domain-containing protein n=1 Tax=Glonium stellatum TaxID=574774 RepID=A0A8E2F7X1_9PEZI|nr:hypothetical protein AOQ84DRAFT_386279 [Glonium stellatum]